MVRTCSRHLSPHRLVRVTEEHLQWIERAVTLVRMDRDAGAEGEVRVCVRAHRWMLLVVVRRAVTGSGSG